MHSIALLQPAVSTPEVQRVLVVEDHPSTRQSLVALIESEAPMLRCVGSAASAKAGLQLAHDTQPHCVLLDADLAGEDGIALIPLIQKLVNCRVVVLSSHADEALSAYAARLGASACIHKLAPATELLRAVSMIAVGVKPNTH